MSWARLFSLLLCLSAATATLARSEMSRQQVNQEARQMTDVGRQLFFDPRLSGSSKQSCASCHDPVHAFGPPGALPIQFGGVDLVQPGHRAVPSLKYLQAAPQFTEHFFDSDDEADESVDNGPTGGLTWDGRVDRGRDQARIPLLSPFEMANASPNEVVTKVARTPYAQSIRRVFGPDVFANSAKAFAAILKCLETFEQDPSTFYPYNSKYDAYLADEVELTPQEARGLAAFVDPRRGNCDHCHISHRGLDGTPPQFTDYGFIALGIPRNPAIPVNANHSYYDLGLCGPDRIDLANRPEYCGLFMTPTLRNVATRHVFFHNGLIHSLRDAVAFYATRDSDPGRWYPRAPDGTVRKFDDLPPKYRTNVNNESPFGAHEGDRPPLTENDIDDVVAFLQTLTDGYTPPSDPPHR